MTNENPHPDWEQQLAVLRKDRNLRFPQHPRLPDDLDVCVLPDALGVLVHGSNERVLLRYTGTTLPYLLPLLNGERSVEQIVDISEASPSEVLGTLIRLHSVGLLVDGTQTWDSWHMSRLAELQLKFWDRRVAATRFNSHGRDTMRRLGACSVAVAGSSLLSLAVATLLRQTGVGRIVSIREPSPLEADLDDASDRTLLTNNIAEDIGRLANEDVDLVVISDTYLSGIELDGIDDKLHQLNQPWLRAVDSGEEHEVGPLIVPYRTGCMLCMTTRSDASSSTPYEDLAYQQHVSAQRGAGKRSLEGEYAPAVWKAASHIAQIVASFLTQATPILGIESIQVLSHHGLDTTRRRFLRVPRCRRCSGAARRRTHRTMSVSPQRGAADE